MKRNVFFKSIASAVCLLGMLVVIPITANAATAPKSTAISPGIEYTYSSDASATGAIHVTLDEPEDYITNIKSKSSSLKARVTYSHSYYDRYSDGTESKSDSYYAVIGLYAKKNVKTTLTFDIYDKNNKKKETKKVKVIAQSIKSSRIPVKSVTFNKKPVTGKVVTAKSGNLKVNMNKNFKLVKLELGTYSAPKKTSDDTITTLSNSVVYKKIKNNKKITLGRKCYTYAYTNSNPSHQYFYNRFNTDILAPTFIRVTYQDKKTKHIGNLVYTINRIAD